MAGELSAQASAIEAGRRKRATALDKAAKLVTKMSVPISKLARSD